MKDTDIKVTVFEYRGVKFYKFRAKEIDHFTQALYDEKFWEIVEYGYSN